MLGPWPGRDSVRGGRWRGEGAKGAMAAPEGGKAAGHGAVRLCGLPWLAHEPAVEAQGLDAALAQARLDAAVERDRRALVAPGPENAAGVCRGRERDNDRVGVAADDVEAPAARREALLHSLQRPGEAPISPPRQAGGRCEPNCREYRYAAPGDLLRPKLPAGRPGGSRRAARRCHRSRWRLSSRCSRKGCL